MSIEPVAVGVIMPEATLEDCEQALHQVAFAGRAGRDWRRAVAGALIVAVAVLLARGWLA